MAKQPVPQDRKARKLTRAELEKALAERKAEEETTRKMFITEYNALCKKYGYVVKPQLTIGVVPLQPTDLQ